MLFVRVELLMICGIFRPIIKNYSLCEPCGFANRNSGSEYFVYESHVKEIANLKMLIFMLPSRTVSSQEFTKEVISGKIPQISFTPI